MRPNHSAPRWSRGRHGKPPTRPVARASLILLAATLALVSLAIPARGHVTSSFTHLWNDHILPLIQLHTSSRHRTRSAGRSSGTSPQASRTGPTTG